MNIEVLEGSELSSVIFNRDYLQLVFEDDKYSYILTSLLNETLSNENNIFIKQTEGWRDALCSLINKVVKIAFEDKGVSLNVLFEDGEKLLIALNEKDFSLKGKEAAILSYGEELVVWHSY